MGRVFDMAKNLKVISGVSASEGIAKLLKAAEDGEIAPAPSQPAVRESSHVEYMLDLPWPPSMNAYWGLRLTKQGQRIIVVTKKGTDYQKLVRSLVAMRWMHGPICYKVAMLIEVWAPSEQYSEGGRWFFDIDNRCKPVLDALAKAGVLQNDKLVRDVRIVDRGVDPPGKIKVWIRPFAGY